MNGTARILDTAPVDALFIPVQQPASGDSRAVKRVWPDRMVAVVLAAIVLLAPLPVASNHPLAWLVWAVVIGVVGAVHSVFAGRRRRAPDQSIQVIIGLGGAFVIVAVWQGGYLPSGDSIAPTASLLAAVRIATYLGFFLLMLRVAENRRIAARMSQVLFLGITLHALLAMVSLNLLGDSGILVAKTAYQGAATGSFINKNAFATFLGMGLVAGLATVRIGRGNAVDRMQYAATWLCLGIILIALVNTQSRMGMAATLLGAMTVVLLGRVSRKVVVPALAGLVVVVAIYGQALLGRFAHIADSGVTRLELYRQVLGMIRAKPFTGFGIDTFPLAFEMFHRPPVTAGFV